MGDYDFVIRLKEKIHEDNLKLMISTLEMSGFECRLFPDTVGGIEASVSKGERMVFLKYSDYTSLLMKADELNLEKEMLPKYLLQEWMMVTDEQETQQQHLLEQMKLVKGISLLSGGFRSQKMKKFIDIKNDLPAEVNQMEKFRNFNYDDRAKFSEEKEDQEIFEKIFMPSEQLMLKRVILEGIELEGKSLMEWYREEEFIHNAVPLHQKGQKPKEMNVMEIRKYFGDNISIYFEFVEFFQKNLLPLVVLGLLVGCINEYLDYESSTSPYDSIYSVVVILWASIFYSKWRKHEKQQQILSCSQSSKQLKKTNKLLVTAEDSANFTQKIDYVTGKKGLHFPTKKRLIKYVFTILTLLPFIAIAITFLILSLNMRGYVDPTHKFLYIEYIYAFSLPGGIFDREVWYLKLLATLVHVNVFQKLNSFYRREAEKTSKKELHSTLVKKNNSLILKRFLFEMLYTFMDLSYIAFVRFDIEALKKELVAIYSADEVRRVITESIIPYFTKLRYRKQQEAQREKEAKKTDEQQVLVSYFEDVMLELQLPKYEAFDDYLEIVINFGYISLFAAAFPYAPILIYFFNAIELFSDKHKIYYLYQRPQPYKITDIGIWNQVLSLMSIICVLTNIILFSFSSDQITKFFPFIFNQPQEHQILLQAKPASGQGKYLVVILFVIEHFLFVGIYLLRKFIKSKEDWTEIYLQRKEYFKKIKYISHKQEEKEQGAFIRSS